jgi:CRISPR-associated protein Cas1
MIKRTIEISSGSTYLSVKNEQLVIRRDREIVGTVPCEDVGILIVDHPGVTYTHGVLTTLARVGAVLIACGSDHHPQSYVLPVHANTLHTERLRLQVESTRPCSKRIWKQIVKAKIRAQADLLGPDNEKYRRLRNLESEVRSGDPSNVEAQAAKVYWRALFPEPSPLGKGGPQGGSFHRDRNGSPPNNLLNYGYMAIRAAVARAICVAGLHPSIGLHHSNRYNAFCLADDLVEPFRPLIDARVRTMWNEGHAEINRETKTNLLGVLTQTVTTAGESGPLMVGMTKMMASLVDVLAGKRKRLDIPSPFQGEGRGEGSSPCT